MNKLERTFAKVHVLHANLVEIQPEGFKISQVFGPIELKTYLIIIVYHMF